MSRGDVSIVFGRGGDLYHYDVMENVATEIERLLIPWAETAQPIYVGPVKSEVEEPTAEEEPEPSPEPAPPAAEPAPEPEPAVDSTLPPSDDTGA
jgi:hypothetical protein